MRVGAGQPVGMHPRQRRPLRVARPRHVFACNLDGQVLPVHVRVRVVEVQVLRDHAVVHGQRRLDQPRDARRPFQVPDVRFDGAQQQRPFPLAVPTVRRCDGAYLDGVAQVRARPVRLQVVDHARLDARPGKGLLHHPFLRRPVGHRQPRARSVLVHGRPAHDGPDAVAVGLRLTQPLQHHHAAALAAHVAVARRVEGAAPSGRGQHPHAPQEPGDRVGQDGVDASDERQIDLAPLQGRGRLVYGRKR